MKLPIQTNRYCPHCKKVTNQKISVAKQKARSSAHPMSWGSRQRAKMRGVLSGTGNKGRWGSKPPIARWKRKTKSTKRLTVLYTCSVCKKAKQKNSSIRTARLEVGEKISK